MKKMLLIVAGLAVSSTGCGLLPMPSCFTRGDSCPAMGCSAEMGAPMGYDGCSDCGPSTSAGMPAFPYSEAPISSGSSTSVLPSPGATIPANN